MQHLKELDVFRKALSACWATIKMIVLLQKLHKQKGCVFGSNSIDLDSRIKSVKIEVKWKPNFRFFQLKRKKEALRFQHGSTLHSCIQVILYE